MAVKEMSFLDHLEELRWHLVRSFAAIFLVAIIVFANINFVFDEFLLAHLKPNFIVAASILATLAKIIASEFKKIEHSNHHRWNKKLHE